MDDLKLELKEIKELFFVWKWNILNETCAICRSDLQEVCIECQSGLAPAPALVPGPGPALGLVSGTDCNIVWGHCGHCYHQHCIFRWLKKNNTCPLDTTDWSTVKISKIS